MPRDDSIRSVIYPAFSSTATAHHVTTSAFYSIMSKKGFVYSPVLSHSREIRCLALLPGQCDEPLACKLSTVSLASKPPYDALSYVWGAPAEVVSSANSSCIVLEGHVVPVTTNLYMALQRLRPGVSDDPVVLWVDAVCIDQNNTHERSEQVALMQEIYGLATNVIIWLGEEEEDEDLVFSALPTIAEFKTHDGLVNLMSDVKRQVGRFFFSLSTDRPWLSRVWILQEFALAPNDPLVVLGGRSVRWSTLMGAWRVIAEEALAPLGSSEQYLPLTGDDDEHMLIRHLDIFRKIKLDVLAELREKFHSDGGLGLWKLLIISRTAEATDPRDRIYGLLGLLEANARNPELSTPILVDYRKSTAEVYTDAMTHIFSCGEGPFFLSGMYLHGEIGVAPTTRGFSDGTPHRILPSWVPDFSRQVGTRTLQPWGIDFHPASPLSASGDGRGADNGRALDDGRTLRIAGLFVDTVDQVITLGTNLDAVIANLPVLQQVADEAMSRRGHFEESFRSLMEQFKKSEPLWRVLVANKKHMSGYDVAPDEYEDMFAALLKDREEATAPCPGQNTADKTEYELILQSKMGKRAFFTTVSGLIGICIPDSKPGDIITICFGAPSPWVLRPQPEHVSLDGRKEQLYSLIGCAYVGGIMAGEMVNELYCEDLMDATIFFIR